MKSLGADVINFLNFGHFDELIDENVALGTGMVEKRKFFKKSKQTY